jgi:glycosyltransferase involved in cell wall biosynthesis
MKHVWILNHYALEPGGAGGTRHYSLSRHLSQHGWAASIIAASVELNSGRQRLKYGERYRDEVHDGVTFRWIYTPTYNGNGFGRILNMLAYAFRALLPRYTAGLARPDVVIGSTVHPFAALSGAFLARRYRVPFVFEVRDLWPQTLIDLGRIKKNSIAARVMRWLERYLYRRATKIIVLLPRAGDYIASIGVNLDKIVWIPNGVELTKFNPSELDVKEHSGKFVLMYFGAHGQANGLDNVLRAMQLVQVNYPDTNVQLRLVGDGPLKKSLQSLAVELSLQNVSFEPPVPKSEIPVIANQATGFVFNLVDAPVFKYGVSANKLFDYMASARPIIFCSNAANNPVNEARCGLTVSPEDPVSLCKAIVCLANETMSNLNVYGRNARRYVEQTHGVELLSERLAKVLDDSLNQN